MNRLQQFCSVLSQLLTWHSVLSENRQFNNAFYCQAPQTPTYNFSTPATAGGSTPQPATGRKLAQTGCNRIAYYAPCGKISYPLD